MLLTMEKQGREHRRKLNMYEPAVFCIRIQGELDADWSEYFGAQSVTVAVNEAGFPVTTLTSDPVDQAGLIGMINRVNALGLPLVSVECLSTE